MSYFDWCKKAYDSGWTDAEKLKVWVSGGKITAIEYKTITGIDYMA